jgi:prepilin-type N-terminal cleavage/methylation domain-containing protein/prepilin-type processing-associated H-X9-DG protein
MRVKDLSWFTEEFRWNWMTTIQNRLAMRSEPERRFHTRFHGFTLIEILVVVGIIAVLIALLLPVMIGAKRAARKVECMANVRALSRAWEQYHTAHMGQLIFMGDTSAVNEMGFSIAWVTKGPDEEGIKKGGLWPYTQTLRIYRCPSDPSPRLRSYSGNSFLIGDYSLWSNMPETIAAMNDAPHTFVFTEEALQNPPPGQAPGLTPFIVSPAGDVWESVPASFHRDGVNVSFADGHCEFYRFSDPRTAKISAPKTSTPNNPDLKQFQSWIGVNLARYQSPIGSTPSK